MQSGTTRCLDEDLEPERCQKITKPERQITGAGEGAPVELRLLAFGLTAGVLVRVEIKHHEIGKVEHRFVECRLRAHERATTPLRVGSGIDPGKPRMQFESSHLSQPEQGGEVLTDEIAAVAFSVTGVDRDITRKRRRILPVLLIEALAGDTVGIPGDE